MQKIVKSMKALADLVFDEGLLPDPRTIVLLLCLHIAKGVNELSGNSFLRALILSLQTITLRIRFQHMNFRET